MLEQATYQTLTYSAISAFLRCQKEYQFRYVLNLVKKYDRVAPLFFGKLIHNCLAIWHLTKDILQATSPVGGPRDADSIKAYAMIEGYANHYGPDDVFSVTAIEEEFERHITHPDTGRKHSYFLMAGKKDGVVYYPEEDTYDVLEHKTTSSINTNYLERIWSDLQIQLYCLFETRPVTGATYNILQKWNAKPRKNEKLEDYRKRLTEVYSSGSLFHRERIFFTEQHLHSTYVRIWNLADAIYKAIRTESFLHNPNNCFSVYGRKCPYYELCSSGESSIVKNNFYEIREPHEELREELPPNAASDEKN
jgi:hypothetical protein